MIVAIKDKDKVVVGVTFYDMSFLMSQADCIDAENLPVKILDNGNIVGSSCCDVVSDAVLFDPDLSTFAMDYKGIVTKLIPHLKQKFEKLGALNKSNGFDNNFIICDNDNLIRVCSDFSVVECYEFACLGMGSSVMGTILTQTRHLSPEERILHAVSFVSKLYKEDAFPLAICDTKSKQFKYYYKGENQ